MIVYVDSKTDKVELTKNQLEKLLKEEYDKGYKEGKEFRASTTYYCPWPWSCPYRNGNVYYTNSLGTTSTSATVTGKSSSNTITADGITTGTIGTVTISTSNINSKTE